MIGEYWDIGDAPLKAPVGVGGFRAAGGGARLLRSILVAIGPRPKRGGLLEPELVMDSSGLGGRCGCADGPRDPGDGARLAFGGLFLLALFGDSTLRGVGAF